MISFSQQSAGQSLQSVIHLLLDDDDDIAISIPSYLCLAPSPGPFPWRLPRESLFQFPCFLSVLLSFSILVCPPSGFSSPFPPSYHSLQSLCSPLFLLPTIFSVLSPPSLSSLQSIQSINPRPRLPVGASLHPAATSALGCIAGLLPRVAGALHQQSRPRDGGGGLPAGAPAHGGTQPIPSVSVFGEGVGWDK